MPNNRKKTQPKLSATQLAKLKYRDLLKLIPGGRLESSCHSLLDDGTPEGVCVMEAVSWVAGEPFSDRPECACPVLTDLAIDVNDTTDDSGRQELIKAIPALVGSKTASKRTYFRRVRALVTHLMARAKGQMSASYGTAPARLLHARLKELLGMKLTAKTLEEFVEIAKAMDEMGDGPCIDEDVLDTLAAAADKWDSEGITYDQYKEVFDEISLNSLFDGDEVPQVFVDIATQRAN